MEFFRDLEQNIRAQHHQSKDTAQILELLGSASTSIAVLDNGVLTAKCYSNLKHDEETAFQACSVSKPIAAVAVMRLVSQGLLKLNAPIVRYLPIDVIHSISTPSTHDLVQRITVAHLLSHTSGLGQMGFPGYVGEPPTLTDILSGNGTCNTLPVHLEGFPGHKFSYSGGGFCVLQLILEKVMHKPFPEIMQDLVFTPLNMTRSFYSLGKQEKNFAASYQNGITPSAVPYHRFSELMAGGLWTTPSDLLQIVKAIQNSLNPSEEQPFLPHDLTKRMLTEVSSSMALSWFAPADPGNVFYHGGNNLPGFHCMLLGYGAIQGNPKLVETVEKCGLCVMTNSLFGNVAYEKLFQAVIFMKGWPSLPNALGFANTSVPFYIPETAIQPKWSEWVGEWEGGKWRIESHSDGAYVSFEDLPRVRLLPVSMPEEPDEVWMRPSGLERLLHFSTDEGAKVIKIRNAGTFEGTAVLRR